MQFDNFFSLFLSFIHYAFISINDVDVAYFMICHQNSYLQGGVMLFYFTKY